MELVSRLGVQYLCFDAVGVGAGVGATFKESWDSYFPVDTSQPEWARYRPHWIPIKSGEKPQHEWIASERRWKEDKYTNIRAQLSWVLMWQMMAAIVMCLWSEKAGGLSILRIGVG